MKKFSFFCYECKEYIDVSGKNFGDAQDRFKALGHVTRADYNDEPELFTNKQTGRPEYRNEHGKPTDRHGGVKQQVSRLHANRV